MDFLNSLPKAVVDVFVKKVTGLVQKYAVTLNDLESEIERTEKEFSFMLDELTGSESDMKGLAELKKLLRGVKTMSENKNIPDIRFNGFTEPWEQRKLGDIADKVTEKNVGLQYIETLYPLNNRASRKNTPVVHTL